MKRIVLFVLSICSVTTFAQADLNTPSGSIGFTTNPTDGNVGIGTPTPSSKLDVKVNNSGNIVSVINAYNGDPNIGIKLLAGAGDGAGYTGWNGGLGSWQGIAFHSMLDGITRGVFNVRDGSFFLKGNIKSEGVGTNYFGSDMDVNGNLTLRNKNNVSHAGAIIHFTSQDINNPGPRIRSDLHAASGSASHSALVLSSYWEGYKDELTLINGNVGIGTTGPDAKLAVKGTVHANEVRVDLNGAVAPDYVFEKNYALTSLDSVQSYISQNKHLPEVPSAKEMEANGVKLGEMNMLLLKKVEELTLYMIEQQKEIKELRSEVRALKASSK